MDTSLNNKQRYSASSKEESSPYILPKIMKNPSHHTYQDELGPDHGFFAHVGKLKGLIKDKDGIIHSLKNENYLLKQLANRQQKELNSMDAKFEEAPKTIHALQKEIFALKQKIKSQANQMANDVRNIRQISDQTQKLTLDNEKLQNLLKDTDLESRHELENQLNDTKKKIQELENIIQENSRKNGIVEKSLNTENKNLRHKLQLIEIENNNLKEKNQNLEKTFKDNQKEIASLSVYKYNALHKSKEQCKECVKRIKEDAEKKRKEGILAKLPTLNPPIFEIESIKSANLKIQLPPIGENIDYSLIKIRYQCEGDEGLEELIIGENELITKNEMITINFNKLKARKYYVFQLCTGKQDVEGTPIISEPFYFDVIPQIPAKPIPRIINKNYIHLTVEKPENTNADKYHFYYSNTNDFKDCIYIGEVMDIEDIIEVEIEARKNIPYYFRCTASNKIGESQPGLASDLVIIETKPPKPSLPNIKHLSATEWEINSIVNDKNVNIQYFKIITQIVENQNIDSPGLEPVEIMVENNNNERELKYVLKDVLPTRYYKIKVLAGNKIGDSEVSDSIVSITPIPNVLPPSQEIISTTSFRINFVKHSEDISLFGINNYKMIITDSINSPEIELIIPIEEESIVLEELKPGASYDLKIFYSSPTRDSAIPTKLHAEMPALNTPIVTFLGALSNQQGRQPSTYALYNNSDLRRSNSSSRKASKSNVDIKVSNANLNTTKLLSSEKLNGSQLVNDRRFSKRKIDSKFSKPAIPPQKKHEFVVKRNSLIPKK